MAYTDLLNTGLDNLVTYLSAVSGLRVVSDVRDINVPCVLVDAPSFDMYAGNGNVVKMNFPVKVIGSGPANLSVLRQLLSITSKVLASEAIVMSGNPTVFSIGGAEYPCYDLVISTADQAV